MSLHKTKIHFIAIGGSIMHNLALALHDKGYKISGSDDAIHEPSKSKLEKEGLLPSTMGWDENKITSDLDCVILGMHAKKDNPELLKAQEIGIKIYSFPEYIYKQSIDKQRIVIAGSHGKTSTTAMIMFVLKKLNIDFDYAVGATIDGFDRMVRLTEDAPFIIIEGDEYLSSPLDSKPKFLNYFHHIAVLNGIAWDHINVFKTVEEYNHQFELLSKATPKSGVLIYNSEDKLVKKIAGNNEDDILKIDYKTHPHKIKDGITYLKTEIGEVPLKIFGEHNLINLSAAKAVCERVCVKEEDFYSAIQEFEGAGKRLETISSNSTYKVFKDFAHSPSKVKATVEAVKAQYGKQKLTAVLELHTFSSLTPDFLPEYEKSMDKATTAIVHISNAVLAKKGNLKIDDEFVKKCFKNKKLIITRSLDELNSTLTNSGEANMLFMSSGTFDGLDLNKV